MIKSKKLEKGDTIGIISPSAGLAAIFPHRLDNAIRFLKKQRYKIKEFSCTRKIKDWESAPAKERAKDIMDAFLDKNIKAIICTIGGNTANKTLQYLNFNKIKENPKIFCGYSDISVLHFAFLTQSNLTTFYGPCIMIQFGEFPKPLDYTINYFEKAVSQKEPIGKINASEKWTDETLDWSTKKDLKRARKLKTNKGFTWLRNGEAKGKIIGGCLSSITHLLGTKYWPDFNNKILFIELPEGEDFDKGESLQSVDALLCDLNNADIFKKINGLIVGRPFKYNKEENEKFKKIILENTKDYNFPILYGVDIGHTDPQITIPLGVETIIDSKNNKFEIVENGVL